MANFNKEVTVAFEELLGGFEDGLVASKHAKTYKVDAVTAERSADVIWRPQPYIMPSVQGLDISASLAAGAGVTQLSVPAPINIIENTTFRLNANELRDSQQVTRIMQGAKQKLASQVNVAVSNLMALTGSLVVRRTVAPTGFDDLAAADDVMNAQGVPMDDRKAMLVSPHYNAMAGQLGRPQTSGLQKAATAYEKAYLGPVAGFDTAKADYGFRLLAAGATGVTINGANQRYVPVAVNNTAGGPQNVDNRFQVITITVASGTVRVGDAFTIAGVNAVHAITKEDTGQLRTFRVTRIVTGGGGSGTVEITPPIISADSSPTYAETQYRNCTAAPANGAAITFLNTQTGLVSPFWQGDAYEVLPTPLIVPPDSGILVARGTTENGYGMAMFQQADIGTLNTTFRLSVRFGVVNLNPQMAGIFLFNQ